MSDEDVVVSNFRAFGDTAHFFGQVGRDEWFKEAGLGEELVAVESAEAADGGDVNANEVADEGFEKPAVLESHFARGAFEVEKSPTTVHGECAFAFAPSACRRVGEFCAYAGDPGVHCRGIFNRTQGEAYYVWKKGKSHGLILPEAGCIFNLDVKGGLRNADCGMWI